MRYGTKDSEWTDFLTKEEHAEYMKEMACRRWCFERMRDHESKILGLKNRATSRRAEVKRSMKEAAE